MIYQVIVYIISTRKLIFFYFFIVRKGDIVTVLNEIDDGWWEGELNGKTGIFPVNYCEYVLFLNFHLTGT